MVDAKQARESMSAEFKLLRLSEENAVMAEIGRIINSSLVITKVLAQVSSQIQKLIPFDRLRITLVDHENNVLKTVYVSGVEVPDHLVGNQVPLLGSSGAIGWQSGRVRIVQGMDESELSKAYAGFVAPYRAGLRSFMVVPLISNNKVVGAIGLLARQPNAFVDDDARIAENVASQISGAIANARLFAEQAQAEESQRRLAEENAVVAEIGKIISSSADISEVYAQFGQVVNQLLQFDRISVTSADTERGEAQIVYAWGIKVDGRMPGDIFPLDGTTTGGVIREKGAVVNRADGVLESAHREDLSARQRESGIKSSIAVPLRVKNETVGTLQIHSRKSEVYHDRHVRLLETIADQISGAIANAQLYAAIASSEVKLRDSEAKLRAVLETASDGILTIDGHGIIESLNPAAAALFGYSADELIGENVSALMPEPYHEGHHGYISNYLSTGHTGVIGTSRELVGLRKDGTVFPMELSVSEIELDGRRSFAGIIRDITERQRADEELRQFATIVESVNDPIIAINNEMRITVWNRAAEELYGHTTEEALGETLELITPPGAMPVQSANTALALDGQRISNDDTQRITKKGDIIDVSANGSPIFGQHGEVIGAVGVHRDMTGQKKAERAQRESEERFNARLLEEKTRAEEIQVRKTQQLQTIFEIAEALVGPADFHKKAEAVSNIIYDKLEADGVALRMLDEDTQTLNVVAGSGSRFVGLPDSLSLAEDGFSQRAFREGKSLLIEDYSKIPDAKPGAIARGLKSICAIGLRGADGPNGLLNIASRDPDHFNQERLELLETIAGAIAALFESARLSEIVDQNRKEMAVEDEIARIITTTLDIEVVYDDFFAEMKKLINFDQAELIMVDENRCEGNIVYSTKPNVHPISAGQTYELSGTILERVIELRQGISIPDLTEARYFRLSEKLTTNGILSLLATPLIFEDKVIGQFALYSTEKNFFTVRERLILDRIARQVAPSVRNSILYQEADRFALALDSIGEAVAFLDLDLKVRHVNRAFEDTFGYTADDLQGQTIQIIGETPDEEIEAEIFENESVGGWSGEVIRKTKSGELLDVLLNVAPVKDKSGQMIGWISVSRNITERKKTAERLTEQSRLASVGELAAGVAHEINNPLTTILLGSQLMSESDLPRDTLADLVTISNAARRAATIVQSLLLFARREDPQREAMGLDTVVEQALELKKYDFRENNINTVLDFEQQLPNCLVDNQQMSQVIVNILNNAEQALVTHRNGGEITIKIQSTPETVTVEIRDDGPGIEPKMLHKIFEPFFTTKEIGEGTGLGLSICHGIVQQHGGEMWAASKIGAGMPFFVQLPITSVAGVSPSEQNQPTGLNIASKGRLLVVDDEPAIRQLVAKGLGEDFEMVDQAPDGEAALAMIQSSIYDCILLDLKMPGISGMEVYERTAGYDHGLADRIIIMTGDTASPETASFLAALGNAVIHKPFTLEDVKENISKVIGKR